ncbi:MAG: alpha/beta hydrolase [Anaerolineae bacterium]|jgi:pimeloyl-ACP methyl ester carboxylesterase|nr:alpha/beta hydrolase [Anaerolineae bacterium]
MSEIPVTFITVQGLNVAQAISGQGPPLLLLHGWGASLKLVWPLAERLARAGYRVYALDLPGFGASDPPPAPWTVYDYAAFVTAYLDAHGLPQVHLFGHSFGGRLGIILGAQQPQRLQKLVLAGSAGVRAPAPLPVRLRLAGYKALRDALHRAGLRALAERLRAAYNARYGSTDFQQATGVMRATFVNVVNEDLLPLAARVQRPTLLFWGDQDTDTPLWQGQRLEQTIPDAGLIVQAGAGHYSYLERVDETARVMDHFFRQAAAPHPEASIKRL